MKESEGRDPFDGPAFDKASKACRRLTYVARLGIYLLCRLLPESLLLKSALPLSQRRRSRAVSYPRTTDE